MTKEPVRILVVGGGYVGMYTALRLQRTLRRKLQRGEVEIVVVEPDPYMTYQPFLPEAAAGSISPRHVVVPLRRTLSACRIIVGEATSIDHAARVATVETVASSEEGAPLSVPYDELVLAPGSIVRTLPVPGLAEHGIGFKSVEEAIALRNHVLEQLDIASSTRNVEVRDAALTFVFVGGGYAGVEALGELEDMARYACRYYHNLNPEDLRFLLVEASDRILPEVGSEMGRYALRELRRRNIDVRLETRLDSCRGRVAVLSDGSRHPARTLVWTAGVKPHPVLAATDLPRNGRGRLRCTPQLRVVGTEHAWSAGDCAAVPDLTATDATPRTDVTPRTDPKSAADSPAADSAASSSPAANSPGKDPASPTNSTTGPGEPDPATTVTCAPNAQHAVRQARRLAENITAALDGAELTDYRHPYSGSVASLGLHKGVAHVYGRKLKGYPAWLLHRAYHLSRVPTFNRKAKVLAEWTLSGLFKREIVSLGSLEHPRAEFEVAARTNNRTDRR